MELYRDNFCTFLKNEEEDSIYYADALQSCVVMPYSVGMFIFKKFMQDEKQGFKLLDMYILKIGR